MGNARKAKLKTDAAEIDKLRKIVGAVEIWGSRRYDWFALMDWLCQKLPDTVELTVEQLRDAEHSPRLDSSYGTSGKTSNIPNYNQPFKIKVSVAKNVGETGKKN